MSAATVRIADSSATDSYAKTDMESWESLLSVKEYVVDTPTVDTELEESLEERVQALLNSGSLEEFEYGMENDFTRRIDTMVRSFGENFIRLLASFFLCRDINVEVASEALRCLGRIEDLSSYPMRIWFLCRCLFSQDSLLRDAAALGLASMDDPQALPYLRKAIENETEPALRDNLIQVLEQLEATVAERTFEPSS